MSRAVVTHIGMLDMQVCVPAEWTDKEVEEFANAANPAGGDLTWSMVPADSEFLAGDPVRNPCAERVDYVHIMLEC